MRVGVGGWGAGVEGRRDSPFDKLRTGFDRLKAGSQRTLRMGVDGYNGSSIEGAAPVRASETIEVRSANSPSQRTGAQVQHLVHSRTRRGFRGNR
jgi:hypothetical protein